MQVETETDGGEEEGKDNDAHAGIRSRHEHSLEKCRLISTRPLLRAHYNPRSTKATERKGMEVRSN